MVPLCGTGAQADRIDDQPDRVDPDYRSNSRSQPAQAPARDADQRMASFIDPRVSSTWMLDCVVDESGICTATKAGRPLAIAAVRTATASWPPPAVGPLRSASTTQRVRVQSIGQRDRRDRPAWLPTRPHSLHLEVSDVAPVCSPSRRLDNNRSAHVSTMKLRGHEPPILSAKTQGVGARR